ncbi:hypothetical protein Tco_1146511 [Tanacetum coccineum]
MGELTFFLGTTSEAHKKDDNTSLVKITMLLNSRRNLSLQKSKDWKHTNEKTQKPLAQDEEGKRSGCSQMYKSRLGSLMYLTSSRHDIMFAVCACARYQVNLKVSHLHTKKRIFRETDMLANSTTDA